MKNNLRGELSRIDFYLILLCLSLSHMCVAYLFLEWNIKGITDSLAATIVTPQIANNSSNPVWLAFFMSLKYFLFFFDLFSEFTMCYYYSYIYYYLICLCLFCLLPPPSSPIPLQGWGLDYLFLVFSFLGKFLFYCFAACSNKQKKEEEGRDQLKIFIFYIQWNSSNLISH